MRVALGIAVGAVIVLMGLTLVVHGLGMMASPGPSDSFYSANDGLNDFKMKMAQIIEAAPIKERKIAQLENQGAANGLDANVSGANSSDVNRSADNQSAHDDPSTVNPIPFKSPASNAGAINSSELNLSEFNSSEAEQSQLASSQNSSENSSFVNQSLENKTLDILPSKNSTSRTASPLAARCSLRAIQFLSRESIPIIKPHSMATGPCRPTSRALGIAE